MTLKSALTNVFTAKSRIDLETVEQKLADAREALADAEAAGSLSAALSDDGNALDAVEQKLAAARRRVETLETALAEAEKIEGRRLAKVKTDAERARLNAVKQHAGSAARNAAKISDALASAIASYHDMQKDVGRVERLLGARERTIALGSANMAVEVRKLVSVEVARLAAQHTTVEATAWPGVSFSMSQNNLRHGQALSEVEPLSERIRARFDVSGFLGGLAPVSATVDAEAVADHQAAAVAGLPLEQPAELTAAEIATLTAAQAGAEVSSVRLADNWHNHRAGTE